MRHSQNCTACGSARYLLGVGLAFAVVVIFLAVVASIATSAEVQPPVVAKSDNLSLRLTLVPEDGDITMGEPLIAKIDLTNISGDAVDVNLGNNVMPSTYLEILDDKGVVLASTPRSIDDAGMNFGRTLQPGQIYSQYLVVSALYQFKHPGVYKVRVQQLKLCNDIRVLAEDEAQLRVLPFSRVALEARCDQMFRDMRGGTKGQRMPLSAYTKALYSVKDEAALPYLEWMAREWENSHACVSLRRIGGERATQILSNLSNRQDGAGRTARLAIEKASDKRDVIWEMNYD